MVNPRKNVWNTYSGEDRSKFMQFKQFEIQHIHHQKIVLSQEEPLDPKDLLKIGGQLWIPDWYLEKASNTKTRIMNKFKVSEDFQCGRIYFRVEEIFQMNVKRGKYGDIESAVLCIKDQETLIEKGQAGKLLSTHLYYCIDDHCFKTTNAFYFREAIEILKENIKKMKEINRIEELKQIGERKLQKE
jgi:hypothetical protein